jgi:hypothetical protein
MKLYGKTQIQLEEERIAILAKTIRALRDSKIQAIQWRRDRHNDELALGLTPTEPLDPILTYIQALRDLPQQEGFPEAVIWPSEPS